MWHKGATTIVHEGLHRWCGSHAIPIFSLLALSGHVAEVRANIGESSRCSSPCF